MLMSDDVVLRGVCAAGHVSEFTKAEFADYEATGKELYLWRCKHFLCEERPVYPRGEAVHKCKWCGVPLDSDDKDEFCGKTCATVFKMRAEDNEIRRAAFEEAAKTAESMIPLFAPGYYLAPDVITSIANAIRARK
jgi:hypothetical protein